MSDFESDLVTQTKSITTTQLMSFLQSTGVGSQCEVCHEHKMTVMGEDNEPVLIGSQNVRSNESSSWFFLMVCENCGNSRQIAAGVVWYRLFGKRG